MKARAFSLSVPAAVFLILSLVAFSSAENRGITLTKSDALPSKALGTYHALIVGINDYKEWNPLQTAVKDATAIRDVLVDRYAFDEKNVTLRTNGEATRVRIVQDLRDLASGLTERDNLLIYFAGHGQLDDLTGEGYWIPVEGRLKEPTSWISHSVLKAVLGSEKVRLKNVVVIADSCYSGTLLRGGPSLLSLSDLAYEAKLTEAASRRSRQVITSGGLEPVADGGRDGHSLFAYYLIRALEENDREVVDLENLFHTRVWEPVTQVGDQRPNVGRLKTPMDEDGQFVLRNRGLMEQRATLAVGKAKSSETEATRFRGEAEKQERIEAERASLEAERERLEEQRRLMEEKQRLELQKIEQERQELALQKERDRLAREKAAVEAEKQAASQRTASLPSSPGTAALQGRKRAAVFTFSGVNAENQVVKKGFSGVCNMLTGTPGLQVTHALLESPVLEDRGITPIELSPGEAAELWVKTGGIFPKREPKVDAFVRQGRALGADLVIVLAAWRMAGGRGGEIMGQFHLIDVKAGAVLTSQKLDLPTKSYGKLLVRGVRKQVLRYLAGATG